MINANRYKMLGIGDIYDKIMRSERLSLDDGMRLSQCKDINALGSLADYRRRKIHGPVTSYVVNRQINYSNICSNHCSFCAFRRDKASNPGAYLLTHDEILARIETANKKTPLDELHMVGACHPELSLTWFESLLSKIRSNFPDLPIKAFTPVEILHFAKLEKIGPEAVLSRLKQNGLKMMPGGGAEIFDDKLRREICPDKATAKEWLDISGIAHKLGIKTNCTMLFGHIETWEQRIDHIVRLREQQDKSGGFTCFIPLPFLKEANNITLPKERRGSVEGIDRLKTIAISRLMLDNIPHIKAYWVMLGVKLAQTALHFGANDLDGTIIEEKIGHMAGAEASQALTISELENMIRESGFTPRRRNAIFETV